MRELNGMASAAAELLRLDRRGEWRGEPGEHVVVPLGREATVDDLRTVRGKAELVNGRLVLIGPAGGLPGRAVGSIVSSLFDYRKRYGGGFPFMSRLGCVVDLPNRKSFCPDASWYTGPNTGADFPRGAPVFAVEVRDQGDYGPAFERDMADKRADYFAAGALVVWGVDVLRADEICVFRAEDPEQPVIYRRGETAEAEPAAPGWRFPVRELFE